jgi:hypothetical protein
MIVASAIFTYSLVATLAIVILDEAGLQMRLTFPAAMAWPLVMIILMIVVADYLLFIRPAIKFYGQEEDLVCSWFVRVDSFGARDKLKARNETPIPPEAQTT